MDVTGWLRKGFCSFEEVLLKVRAENKYRCKESFSGG
jgi:hypothetical protein